MNPLISIIVPVYNVEPYLEQCLDSLNKQTYSNLEIILVDDGSTDNSGAICDNFAENNRNVIVKHQENKGLSSARNNGVLVSKGEYITFLDSDDWLDSGYVEYLYSLIKKYDADIACSCFYSIWDGSKEVVTEKQEHVEVIKFGKEDALEEICYGNLFGCSAPDKLYRRELIAKNPFPEGRLYEDLATMYKIIGESNSVIYSSKKMSFYRRRRGSIINEQFSEDHMFIIQAAEEQLNYISKNYVRQTKAAEVKCCYVVTQIVPKVLGGSPEEKRVFRTLQSKMRQYWKSMVFNKRVSIKHKIRALSVLCGYRVTRFTFAINDYLKIALGKNLQE